MPLDFTQTYGIITGDDEGRCFEQNGVFYGAGGVDMATAKGRRAAKPAAIEAESVADPVVDAQLAAQMGDA